MKASDDGKELIRVLRYDGEWWLALQKNEGGTVHTRGLAKFDGDAEREAFWRWHRERMAAIADELMELPGVAADARAAIERILRA
ncbi:hypothetical protein [Streptomyces microflavus]|uniref:hypothetical protein n=1 Tax=Streptomyces microflavus TaxID=1919 RepID=UPI00369B9740